MGWKKSIGESLSGMNSGNVRKPPFDTAKKEVLTPKSPAAAGLYFWGAGRCPALISTKSNRLFPVKKAAFPYSDKHYLNY